LSQIRGPLQSIISTKEIYEGEFVQFTSPQQPQLFQKWEEKWDNRVTYADASKSDERSTSTGGVMPRVNEHYKKSKEYWKAEFESATTQERKDYCMVRLDNIEREELRRKNKLLAHRNARLRKAKAYNPADDPEPEQPDIFGSSFTAKASAYAKYKNDYGAWLERKARHPKEWAKFEAQLAAAHKP
jgi:hypothetical protein